MKNLNKMKEEEDVHVDVLEPQDTALQIEVDEPQEQESPEEPAALKKKGSMKKMLANFIGGEMLSKDGFVNLFPFFIYVVLLLMLYITNVYVAEDVSRDIAKTNREAEELHVEYVYLKSEITRITKQSNMVNMLKAKGIKESVEPLRKIVVEKEGGEDD